MRKIMISLLCSLLICASLGLNVAATDTNEKATVALYPKPQSLVTDSDEGLTLSGKVDLLVHGNHEDSTITKLKGLLDEQGLSYQEVSQLGDNAAIVIAVLCDDENCDICKSVTDNENALTKEQGYVLKSSNDTHKNGLVTIVGADSDGAYYGVMSLIQMFDQKTSDGRIAEVTVSDYPDVKFRGYVEGFYGIPWTHEDRAQLFEDTTLYKMTTYIYAPKDDPYHRGSWRTLYPEAEANNIKELAEVAAENNMEFCWTIHPGADYNYTRDTDGNGLADDYETLIKKFEQVYSLGVRQFGIFYDDLSYSVANGIQHSTVINESYEYLTNKYDDVKPFITVVTRYTNSWGAPWDTYFTPFMENIHEDTIVLWTGQSTMSAITKEYMEYPKTQTGVDRDFGVWWNYPVNDYAHSNLFMAPLDCLSTGVDNISSFFLNPMSEADASKVAIYSGADYSWNISDFDSYTSWQRAIDELVSEADEEFERFADNISYLTKGNGFYFDESVYLKDDLESFEAALASGEGLEAEIANLKAKFEQMTTDVETLKTINNKELLDEILSHLNAYNAIAKAGIAAMEAYEAALDGDMDTCIENVSLLDEYLQESTTYRIGLLGGGTTQVKLCTLRILPFLNAAKDYILAVLADNMVSDTDPKMLTNVENLEAKDVTYASRAYAVENITATMNKDDYVAIALPKAMNIYEISATVIPVENFKLQYSLNGIEWEDIDTVTDGNVIKTEDIVTATYARVVCTQDNTNATITRLAVTEAYEAIKPSITTNMPTYRDYVIKNALDNDLTTNFWSSAGSSQGDYICVDLKDNAKLNTVVLYSGINKHGVVDGYASTQLEVSQNGTTWTKVGDALPLSDYSDVDSDMKKLTFNANGVEARYFRLSAVGGSESWAKVYEVEYDAEYTDYVNHMKASTEMTIYRNYTPDKAVDNDLTTWAWIYNRLPDGSETGSVVGDYIQVDLGTLVPLYDASIYFGKNTQNPEYITDGFKTTKLQTSVDGETWSDAGTAINMEDYEAAGSLYLANFKTDGRLVRYIRFVADEDYRSWAKVYEITYNQSLSATQGAGASVSTNLKTYQSYVINNAMDDDMNSKFYSSAATNVGDYIQVDLGSTAVLYDASIYFGGDPNKVGAVDGFAQTQIQVSTDGTTWIDVGNPLSSSAYEVVSEKFLATFDLGGVMGRYVRFTATKASSSWLQAYEIQFNNSVDNNAVRFADEQDDAIKEFYEDSTYINNTTVNINQTNYLDDGDITTAPYIYQVKANDALIYPMTTLTNVAKISVLQEASFISNAQVSVLKTDGTWVDAGQLDKTFNDILVNDTILAVKFTFDGKVQPVIYEIITYASADYTKVDEAIAKVPADLSVYTEETVTALHDAINAVVRGLDESKQAVVDEYASVILDAIAALEYRAADYSKVEEAKTKVPADLSIYTDETVAKLNEALAYDTTKNITEQTVVDGYATAIEDAINNLVLKTADYTKVDEAIAKVPADLTVYTKDSVKILQDALDAVVRDLDITKQSDVDAMALAIENALSGLVKLPVQVDTGDNAPVGLFALAGLAGLCGVFFLRKKKESE